MLSVEFGRGGHLTEMCSGSEAGSYLRRIDFVYDSTLGFRVIMKRGAPGCRHQRDRVWR